MKKLSTFVLALLLTATLSYAQNTGGSTGSPDKGKTPATDDAKKGHKGGKKGHKGGKKSKKGSGDAGTTPPPK